MLSVHYWLLYSDDCGDQTRVPSYCLLYFIKLSTEHFQVSDDKKIDQNKLSSDLTIGLKFQHVIASLPDSDFQWKMEVYQRPELWGNDLFSAGSCF